MADSEAYAVFSTTGLPDLLRVAHTLSRALYEKGHTKLADKVEDLLKSWIADIDATAVVIAGASEGYIRSKIYETTAPNRPHTGEMATHVRSEPGPLGSVAVALIGELDKIINPNGLRAYGPYWRAQEYGTGGEGGVPEQTGRVLYGVFEPSHTAPDPGQRGLRSGRDAAFIPHVPGYDDAGAGFGTIGVELPARHFLRDGTAIAASKYVARLDEVSKRYLGEMQAIVAASKAEAGQRPGRLVWTFRG